MKKLFLLFLMTFLLIGCKTDDDNVYDYIGTWSGTYDGTDKGIWNFVVASDGKVTGTMHSDVNNENYTISGNVSTSGELNTMVGLPSDGSFRGTLADKKGNGTWVNSVPTPDRSGNWTGDKKK
ncbi:hypothetical protein M2347_003408 [Chryseobacterium sp. H1D6B]|uniref:hypothetical protein n=1 Tax=Chryseobacterium sp. H1D6B TaxID=2940588 RepID=UPI0015C986EA|nr:hypothetical protein [Chryseobacterium sp. H1D6B]MDH6253681.1 hypothetical protein [Chryseobacterium sp. H1D6B]